MNKFLMTGLLAALVVLMSVEKSQAWSKFNFGAGFNWSWEGGGNSLFCGLIKGGQSPVGGGPVDGGMDPSMGGYPSVPASPERIMPPTPVKPASFTFPEQAYLPQQQGRGQQPQAVQPPAYSYPSYWYEQ